MRTKSRWVMAAAMLAAVAMSSSCVKATNTLGSGMVWVATQGDQKLTSFSINLTTGALSRVGSAVATGVTPAAMAMTPDQKTVFLANSGDNTISVYSVNSDGSLTAGSCSSPNCNAGETPVALAVDPTGKFLFVANQGIFSDVTSGTVSVFAIGSGAIKQVTTFPTETASDTTGTGPSGVAVSPAGFPCSVAGTAQTCYAIYVTNQFTNTVTGYEYYADSSNNFNFVQALGGSPYAAGINPTGLAFSRCAGVSKATTYCATADGNNLFVTNAGSGTVSTFTACIQMVSACASADGSLLPGSATTPTGIGPILLMVDPVADFVYTVDQRSNQVSQFSYSPVTGLLSALTPAAISTALTPAGGGITGDGSVVVVPNNGSSNVSVYRVGASSSSGSGGGGLVPASPVSLSGQPSAVLVK